MMKQKKTVTVGRRHRRHLRHSKKRTTAVSKPKPNVKPKPKSFRASKRIRDPYWSLPSRIAICHQFRSAMKQKAVRLRKLKSLHPGKQGTVDLEQDHASGIKVVVKRSNMTHSVQHERRAAKKGHEDEFHPWGTQPLIEYRVGRLLSRVLEQKFCPNLVFQYAMDEVIDKGRLSTILECFDHNLHYLIQKRKTVHLSTPFWYSMWFQICAGLISMHRNQTTHSDLHTQNILYKKIKAGGYWTYVIGKHRFHVPNLGYIFAVADYGRARSIVHRAKFVKHAIRVKTEKLDRYGLGWASYDYFRLFNGLKGVLPHPLYSVFDVLPKKGLYPVEEAVKRIYTKLYSNKPPKGGSCLGEYHIIRRISKMSTFVNDNQI